MGRQLHSRRQSYRDRVVEVDGSYRVGPAQNKYVARLSDLSTVEQLQALAAASTVPVSKVRTGARTVSDKQVFLAIHAPDSYQYDMRHFVGDLQARLGMRNRLPVEQRAQDVELTPEEAEAERGVKLRKYWARKRRGPP